MRRSASRRRNRRSPRRSSPPASADIKYNVGHLDSPTYLPRMPHAKRQWFKILYTGRPSGAAPCLQCFLASSQPQLWRRSPAAAGLQADDDVCTLCQRVMVKVCKRAPARTGRGNWPRPWCNFASPPRTPAAPPRQRPSSCRSRPARIRTAASKEQHHVSDVVAPCRRLHLCI